ncbi:SufE family protein [Bacteroidota bacterium]
MTIQKIEQQIIEEFEIFDDWLDKYNYIIEMGKSLPLIDVKFKDENHLITGCQSKVWLHADYRDGKIFFTADSDAVITKGIISLLVKVLSGQTPGDIYDTELIFINEIGLKDHLSPSRSNGLVSMIKQIKLYALAIKTKYNL